MKTRIVLLWSSSRRVSCACPEASVSHSEQKSMNQFRILEVPPESLQASGITIAQRLRFVEPEHNRNRLHSRVQSRQTEVLRSP